MALTPGLRDSNRPFHNPASLPTRIGGVVPIVVRGHSALRKVITKSGVNIVVWRRRGTPDPGPGISVYVVVRGTVLEAAEWPIVGTIQPSDGSLNEVTRGANAGTGARGISSPGGGRHLCKTTSVRRSRGCVSNQFSPRTYVIGTLSVLGTGIAEDVESLGRVKLKRENPLFRMGSRVPFGCTVTSGRSDAP